jgi:hypothetical protein
VVLPEPTTIADNLENIMHRAELLQTWQQKGKGKGKDVAELTEAPPHAAPQQAGRPACLRSRIAS